MSVPHLKEAGQRPRSRPVVDHTERKTGQSRKLCSAKVSSTLVQKEAQVETFMVVSTWEVPA